MVTRVCLAVILLLLSACGRDSGTVLHLQEEGTPLVRSLLPQVAGDPFELMAEVEFGAAGQGEDGRLFSPRGIIEVEGGVAVLDADSNSLKVYESDGTLRLVAGGRGRGPGEFDAPRISNGLAWDGRVFVVDSGSNRFTWVDPVSGDFESMPQQLTWTAANVAADRFVLIRPRFVEEMQVESLELVDGAFDTVATIAAVPPGRAVLLPGNAGRPFMLDQPFWPPFSWWTQGGRVAICQGDAYRVEVFDLAGAPLRILEWQAPLLRVSDVAWDSMAVYVREQYAENWATAMDAMERPEHVAAIEALRIDGQGRIWALRDDGPTYATHIEYPYMYWDVIDTDGSWLGTQALTDVPWYFGEDVCYMVEQRESGAVVVRYRLVPNGSGPR